MIYVPRSPYTDLRYSRTAHARLPAGAWILNVTIINVFGYRFTFRFLFAIRRAHRTPTDAVASATGRSVGRIGRALGLVQLGPRYVEGIPEQFALLVTLLDAR